MSFENQSAFTRRAFLNRGLTLASAAVTVPWFLQSSAMAMAQPVGAGTSLPGVAQDRVLVVVQLAGGNDGLNTVIPYRDGLYYKARPTIGVAADRVLKLGRQDDVGLHPSMTGMKELYDEGLLALVQGVGYPNPNRSHFKSMDIWHTADTSGIGAGWLGRYFDNQCAGAPGAGTDSSSCSGHAAIAIGREAPLAMEGRVYKPISFESQELFKWSGAELHPALAGAYDELTTMDADAPVPTGDTNASFLTRTALDARIASERIRAAVGQRPLVNYPGTPIARQLSMVAQMIRAGLETRVYYVSLGGFDTHAGQGNVNGPHANLVGQLAGAVRAFYADLKEQGNDTRVLTMSFSEFGRRVGQNGSGGTDHGTAAPMFLMGPMVKAGVHGKHPSLADLDSGDLKFHTDFRAVYTGILEDWMKSDGQKVLGRKFKGLEVVKKI